jgi:arylsulfatase A-like enzyme
MPVCSPTRATLMQGRYAWKTGMQQYATIMPTSTVKMAYDQPTIAETLKQSNYSTYAVGKWHLGYSNWKATPIQRGFDYHKGYYQGEIDYYNKSFAIPKKFLPFPHISGLDWWENEHVIRNESGSYNKKIYDESMVDLINNYTPSSENPMFMYYAHQVIFFFFLFFFLFFLFSPPLSL